MTLLLDFLGQFEYQVCQQLLLLEKKEFMRTFYKNSNRTDDISVYY